MQLIDICNWLYLIKDIIIVNELIRNVLEFLRA